MKKFLLVVFGSSLLCGIVYAANPVNVIIYW